MSTESKIPSIYIGCALTDAPEDFVRNVETFKDLLRKTGHWQVMDFLGLTNGGNGDVYRQDIEECVKKCDVFVAVADYPATGLGCELGVADEREIPTLIVAKVDRKITRLALGAAETKEYITFARYGDVSELLELVDEYLMTQVTNSFTKRF